MRTSGLFFAVILMSLLCLNAVVFGADNSTCWMSSSQFPPKILDGKYPRHYRPDRTVDIEHLKIEIRINYDTQSIEGVVHFTVSPIHEDIKDIRLDSAGLTIKNVLFEKDRHLEFDTIAEEDTLILHLPEGAANMEQFTFSVYYEGSPKRYFYWRHSDDNYTTDPDMVFTLTEPIGSASWYPCLDYPSDRITTEVLMTVPKGQVTISNGELLQVTPSADGEWETHHWAQKKRLVTYLVTVIAGPYDVYKDTWRGRPVDYYCMPGQTVEDAKASMGKTPQMIEFFSRIFGVDYAYNKYAQVPVKQFPAGGMEHTSCTTMHEYIVLDERARLDRDQESLIAHELVHQWFGDLLTCESWPHLWLNEGFATYFAAVWFEETQGQDAFMRELFRSADSYLNESKTYTRPIMTNQFQSAREMFDRHSYPKAAWVLHMLRHELGDKLFYRGIRQYCQTHQDSLVDTDDFQEILEQATGRPLDRFFEKWIYGPGHPKLKVEWSWLDKKRQVELRIKQIQKKEENAPPFSFPLQVRIATDSNTTEQIVRADRYEQTFYFDVADEPRSVDVNPDLIALVELDFEKSKEMLIYEATHGQSAVTRVRAIQQLAKKDEPGVTDALLQAMMNDRSWWVQEQAANNLSGIKNNERRDALLDGCEHPDARVRSAVVSSLRSFAKDDVVQKRLQDILDKDPGLGAAEMAARGLGNSQHPDALKTLLRAIDQETYRNGIQVAVLQALNNFEDKKAYTALKRYAGKDRNENVRSAALESLGTLAAKLDEAIQEETVEFITSQAEDLSDRIREAVIRGLRELGHEDGIEVLREIADLDPNQHLRSEAENAIQKIRGKDQELAKKNAGRLDSLSDKQEDILKRLEALEKKLDEMAKKEKQ